MDTSAKKNDAVGTWSKKKAETKPKSPKIYVGPNMGGALPLTQFATYINGLPKPVQERVDSDPDFSRLFCAPEELAAVRAELGTPGSVRSRAFVGVLKKRKGTK